MLYNAYNEISLDTAVNRSSSIYTNNCVDGNNNNKNKSYKNGNDLSNKGKVLIKKRQLN